MKRQTVSIVVAAMVVPLLATQVAAARPAPGAAKTGHQGKLAVDQRLSGKDPVVSPLVIAGYRRVSSDAIVDVAGEQTGGSVSCPTGYQVIGGGVVVSGFDLTENMNASFPRTETTWQVYINNSGANNGTFRVYATCAKKVTKYRLVIGNPVSNPAGAHTSAYADCPAGTVALGGGGYADSFDVGVNMGGTNPPTVRSWRVDINNSSASDTTAHAYAVCGKRPDGYQRLFSEMTQVAPNSQGDASVACPENTVALGGGGFSSTQFLAANLNSSLPDGRTGWIVYENNNSGSSNGLTAWVVCGQLG